MKNIFLSLRNLFVYGLLTLISLPVLSAQMLFSLNSNDAFSGSALTTQLKDNGVGTVHFDNLLISGYKKGTRFDIPIPGKLPAQATMMNTVHDSAHTHRKPAAGETRTVFSLENKAGSVELISQNNILKALLLHDVSNNKIYWADIDNQGNGILQLEDNDNYYCVRYPHKEPLPSSQQSDFLQAALVPDLSTLQNLQSRPGSAKVLYINYWGGSLSNTYWNDNYTGGAAINFTSYDRDGNTGNFSSSERYSMWLAWREAAEDFSPFDINITTSSAVYNATPIANRAQMAVTTTRSWYSNSAGGVALINIFNNNSNYAKTAWTWNLSDTSMGMTISHEAGHQLGLFHDGIGGQSYYSGHGVWGPIMGAPFGKPYVQWSKGDYPNANENEDDLQIISSSLNPIADDAGDSLNNATSLNLPVNKLKGLISTADSDAYRFTLSSATTVQINVITLLGDENEPRAGNLAMDVSLSKITASGNLISTISMIDSADHSPLSPVTNKFDYNANLSSGNYAIVITPNSPNTNWSTGFDNYGNLGEYLLSINALVENVPDLTVQPVSLNDTSLNPGQSFTISTSVSNQGSANANSTTLRYYRSNDASITTDDIQIATDAVAALAANGNSAESANVSAPNATGQYWIGACVDTVTNESNIANNCSSGVQITVANPGAPDLIVQPVSLNNVALNPGQNFTISTTVTNQGTASAGNSTLRYYRSNNSTITTADNQLATDFVAGLAANGNSAESANVSAPNATGQYWIGACVDTLTNESNTGNNCSAGVQISVVNPGAPDLIVQPVNLSDTALNPGQNFTVTTTVTNQGTASAGSSTLRYYRSNNSNITTSDNQLATDFVSDLSANGNSNESATVSAPNSTGQYWIGACVDTVTNESNTANNCSAGVQIIVSNPGAADLVVNSLNLSENSLIINQAVNISANINNQGSASAVSSTLRYYLSNDADITTADTQMTSDVTAALPVNGNANESVQVLAPVFSGDYWIGACVDSVVNESNTLNNCSNGVAITVSDPPLNQINDCEFYVYKLDNDSTIVVCF